MKLLEELIECADKVLVFEGGGDKRLDIGSGDPNGTYHVEPEDWRMWSTSSYGSTLQRYLSNLGSKYNCEVSDMGKAVSVKMSYHNPGTGKTISKNYIILFNKPKSGDGTCFVTMSKWRTFTNINQAVSYIQSNIQSFSGQANNT